MDWITSGALNFLDQWNQNEQPFFLFMATTLNHGPGPRFKKYTGDPLATPAGLLEKPLAVLFQSIRFTRGDPLILYVDITRSCNYDMINYDRVLFVLSWL